jgi:hypothetical protein
MNVCFTSISNVSGFSYVQYNFQKDCWLTWNRIEQFNSNVSTARGQGNLAQSYYVFQTNEEKTKYTNGLSLHVQYLGNTITIVPVSKD